MLLSFKLHSEGKTKVPPRQGHTPQNRDPLIHPQHQVAMQGMYRSQKEMTEEGQKSGSMWQGHWNSGLLELVKYRVPSSIVWSALHLLVSRVFGIDSTRNSSQFCRTHLFFKSFV